MLTLLHRGSCWPTKLPSPSLNQHSATATNDGEPPPIPGRCDRKWPRLAGNPTSVPLWWKTTFGTADIIFQVKSLKLLTYKLYN